MYIKTSQQPTIEIVTLEQAKDWLGINGSNKDDIILSGITSARTIVERLLGRSLVECKRELLYDNYIDDYIELPYPDIKSVTSVTVLNADGTTEALTASSYKLVGNRLYITGTGTTLKVVYTTYASDNELYKTAVLKQLAFDLRNDFEKKGFDMEVIAMLRQETLNLGY